MYRRFAAVCRSGFLSLCCLSAPVFSMTLAELYKLAKVHDPSYLLVRAQLDVSKSGVDISRSPLLPSVTATASVKEMYPTVSTTGRTQPTSASFALQPDESWTVALQQQIFDPKSWHAYRSAQLNHQATAYQLQAADYDLVTRLVTAYFDLLSARQKVENLYRHRTVIEEELHQAQRKFELGSVTIADVQDSQAQYALADADIISARTQERVAQSTLTVLIGQPVDDVSSFSLKKLTDANFHRIDGSLSHWISSAHTQSPSIQSDRLLFKAAQSNISVQRAAHFPVLSFVASTSYDSLSSFGGGLSKNSYFWGVMVSLPIFSGGLLRAQVNQAVGRSMMAQEQYRQTYARVALLAEQNYLNFENGLARLNALQVALSSAKTALAASKLAYQAGTKILLDVLTAENQLYTINLQLVDAMVQVFKSYVGLKTAAGSFSEEDLTFIDSCLGE